MFRLALTALLLLPALASAQSYLAEPMPTPAPIQLAWGAVQIAGGAGAEASPTPTAAPTPTATPLAAYMADANIQGCWIMDGTDVDTAREDQCTDDTDWTFAGTAGYASADGPDGPTGPKAMDFDGVDQRIADADNDKYDSANMTFGCWVKLDEDATSQIIFSKSHAEWSLETYTNNRIDFWYDGGYERSANNALQVSDGWSHVVARHIDDANDYIEIFVDTVSVCSGTCGVDPDTPSGGNAVGIGAVAATGQFPLEGQIYECFFFDRALADAEICDICRFGLDGYADDRTAECNSCSGT